MMMLCNGLQQWFVLETSGTFSTTSQKLPNRTCIHSYMHTYIHTQSYSNKGLRLHKGLHNRPHKGLHKELPKCLHKELHKISKMISPRDPTLPVQQDHTSQRIVHAFIHTCIHTYIHTHIHTYSNKGLNTGLHNGLHDGPHKGLHKDIYKPPHREITRDCLIWGSCPLYTSPSRRDRQKSRMHTSSCKK